jgi:hypothetical protein
MTTPWRAVGLFVLLTICLSGIFWALINAAQTPKRSGWAARRIGW